MRALRLLALAAAMVIPAAAAHAQVGVYVGPSVRYASPGYGPGYGARIHWDHRFLYGRPYVAGPWVGPPVYGFHHEWRGYGRYERGRRW